MSIYETKRPADSPKRERFDVASGNFMERIIYNYRPFWLLVGFLLTCFFATEAVKLNVNSSFDNMLPAGHEFIVNYQENKDDLRGQGNSIQVSIHHKEGDIYDPEFLSVLRDISDAIFLLPGVDRSFIKSLWRPNVRWTEVTAEGFNGGAVMPNRYDGSPAAIAELRENIHKAGLVGSLVSGDQRSTLITVPLLDINPKTGEPLDIKAFSDALDGVLRVHYTESIDVHVVGFAKLVGELIEGMHQVISYFAIAAVMAALAIFLFTHCLRSTFLAIGCSIVAVIWQLGVVQLMGLHLDPYSMLVPFLVFAIGVSHGAQILTGIIHDIGQGIYSYVAARLTFRRLALPGVTALLSDAVGFAVLMVIDIPVIQGTALTASIGVGVLIVTNLILLPVLMSYIGVSQRAATRSAAGVGGFLALATDWLGRFTERRTATLTIICGVVLAGASYFISLDIKVGDTDAGAPELRADSRYNQDIRFISENYGTSSDQLVIIVKTPPYGLSKYESLISQDRLAMSLKELESVQAVHSPASHARLLTASGYESSPKWRTINRDPSLNSSVMNYVFTNYPEFINNDWSTGLVVAYLKDHKAETLNEAVQVVKDFAAENDTSEYQFLLAAGTAGIQAATNEAVERSSTLILYLVYASVILLCFIAFRNWRAVVVAILPLILISLLAEALMVFLGIGIKVATLPVIALGVGVGIDYALYLLSPQLALQKIGVPLKEAYRSTLVSTGKVVALVGMTLAVGVITWAWSPIKFQADMGILLTFMFLANMIAALIGVPALSHFLLSDKYFKAKARAFDDEVSPSEMSNKNSESNRNDMMVTS